MPPGPFTLEQARGGDCLLFECVTGSRAYGTATPESDTDLRGVFILPRNFYFGTLQVGQVSDEHHDETYYEIGRFIELLGKNNPNLLEMLYAEDEMVRFRHPAFLEIKPEMVLSKRCESTFASYAMTQVRKARGLNKKIVNPMEGPRKSVLDFCHVINGQGSQPIGKWLEERGIGQEKCGLVAIPHMREIYGIYLSESIPYRGLIRKEDATELCLSSIPKGEVAVGWMSFNKDGYKRYCKDYREYQQWVENRNESRYLSNVEHGKNYDSKNLMHTFRLLDMAEEIAREKKVRVRRPNAAELLRIRQGAFTYEELIEKAEAKIERVSAAFAASDLPEEPDHGALEAALVRIREWFYLR